MSRAGRRARPAVVLAAGGTITMTGTQDAAASATPGLDAAALVAGVPTLRGRTDIEARTITNVPSAHLQLQDQLEICRAARDAARAGRGVVVTHGTDCMEETAVLADLLHDAEAPVVFTGAIRPASSPGADGPANLVDALAVAQSDAASGLGTLLVFGGEIHHARCARKTDTTSLTAFSSPQTGPLGRVTEGHPSIWSRMQRSPTVNPPRLDRRVPIVPTAVGDDGVAARAVLGTSPHGAIVGTLGAGHLPPAVLDLWAEAARQIPVVAYCRPERGVILSGTYGYAGSEQDLRGTQVIPAGFLSPQAARMKLIACLAAGLSREQIVQAFRPDDG